MNHTHKTEPNETHHLGSENSENSKARITHLLSFAADWEPHREAPDGLAHTALAKHASRSKRRAIPIFAGAWQWSGTAVAMACAVIVVSGRMGTIGDMPQWEEAASPERVTAVTLRSEPKPQTKFAPASSKTQRKEEPVAPRIIPTVPQRELPALIRPRRSPYLAQTVPPALVAPKNKGEGTNTRSVVRTSVKSALPSSERVRVVQSSTSTVPPQAISLEEELVVVPVLYTETDEETNTLHVTPAVVTMPAQMLAQNADVAGTIPPGMPPGTVSTE